MIWLFTFLWNEHWVWGWASAAETARTQAWNHTSEETVASAFSDNRTGGGGGGVYVRAHTWNHCLWSRSFLLMRRAVTTEACSTLITYISGSHKTQREVTRAHGQNRAKVPGVLKYISTLLSLIGSFTNTINTECFIRNKRLGSQISEGGGEREGGR